MLTVQSHRVKLFSYSKGAVDILIRGTFAFLIDRFLENYLVILGGSILHEQIDRAKRV